MTIQECNQYFADHPEKEDYLAHPENLRLWALKQASCHLEIAGVLPEEISSNALMRSACCEEALYLLLHPQDKQQDLEVVQERIDGIGSRTYTPKKQNELLPLSPYVRTLVSAYRQRQKKHIIRG